MTFNKPKYIVLHTSDLSYQTHPHQLLPINEYHRDVRKFPESTLGYHVGYHRLYTSGTRYITRRYDEEGAHCNDVVNGLSMNFQSVGLCIGFDGDIEAPPEKELNLMIEDIKWLMYFYNIPRENIKLHRDFNKGKTCPGLLLPDNWGQLLLQRGVKPAEELSKQKQLEDIAKRISYLRYLLELLKVKVGIK